MAKLVGYARLGKGEEGCQQQIDALLIAGCSVENIYQDSASDLKMPRPGLEACLASLEQGDTLITWQLDRISLSLSHLVTLIEGLHKKGVHFTSICDGIIDTRSRTGGLVYEVFLSLAHFERQIISQRNKAGVDVVRARGRRGGRKKIKHDHPKVKMAKQLSANEALTISTICNRLKVSRATYYRYLAIADY